MPGSGIWLPDETYLQSAGQLWAQQQQQRIQAGRDWAQQAMQSTMQQLQSMVPQVSAAPPAPVQVPPPPVSPAPEEAVAPPISTAPPPAPAPIAPATPPTTPPVAEAPGGPTAEPTPAPPTPSVPTPPPVSAPAPTLPTPDVGESWAQQQIQNLLNPAPAAPQTTPAPGLPPSPTPAPTPTAPPPGATTSTSAPPSGGIDASSPSAFAKSVAPYAQYAAQQLGIDPTWVAAMAASESNYGKAPGNELFGIKGSGTAGTQNLATHEGEYGGVQTTGGFAAYNSPLDAVNGFVDLIKNHYPGAIGAQSLGDFVHGLKQGGYFTAAEPEYRGILQGISDRIGGDVQGVLQGAQNAAQNVVQAGQTAVNTAVQGVQSAVARVSQFGMGLSSGDAMAFCGPAAAMAFAQTYGRNPTVDEAKQLAQQVGWNPNQGMAGVSSEVNLLNAMGVDAHATQGVDWAAVGRDASGGNPVIIDTPGHYYYIDGYNGDTGKFHVGTSGTDLKGGSEWMSSDQINQMPQSQGSARSAIFADHPLAQQDGLAQSTASTQAPTYMSTMQSAAPPSGAVSPPTPPGLPTGNPALDLLGNVSSAVQSKAQDVMQAVTNVGGEVLSTGQNVVSQVSGGLPGLTQAPSDWLQQQRDVARQYGVSDVLGQPLDLSQPLGPQVGIDPYGQIVQQGIPSIVQGVQQGDIGKILGGAVQTGLGALSVLPGTGGAEVAGGRAVESALAPALSDVRLGPVAGAAGVPWSPESLALLNQGPATEAALPGVLRQLDTAAQARTLGISPELLTGNFDELGRRIPQGMIENPATSAELGQPYYDQYGVFQRAQVPETYSARGIAQPYGLGAEMVPPLEQTTASVNALQAAMAANPDATQFVRTAGNLFEPVIPGTPQEASDVLTGLQGMVNQRASSLTDTLQQLTQKVDQAVNGPRTQPEVQADLQSQLDALRQKAQSLGAEPAQINAAFARALGGGAAGGLAAYQTTDPNDPNRWLKIAAATGAGALAAGPGVDLAMARPGGVPTADWLRAGYRGGIIGGFNTAADVVFNSALTPAISGGTGILRDLASFQPGRIQGRLLGAQSGIVNWAGNFLSGLSASLAQPNTVSARAAPGAATGVARGLEGMGALHGAFQNATSQLIQGMEHGAQSGANASMAGLSGPAWLAEFQRQFSGPVSPQVQAIGDRTALRGDLGTLTGAFGRFVTQAGPVGDALFPVYRMGMSMANRMVEFSPLGLAGTALDVGRGLAGRGPYAAGLGSTPAGSAVGPLTERLTNNLVGTALSMWLANKAVGGAITGAGPSDPGQHQVWLADGNQPNSFLGPDGAFHSWEKLPPALRGPMMTAGAYADAVQAYNVASAKQQAAGPQAYAVQDPRMAAASQLISEVGRQLASVTPMRTFANLYDTLQSNSVSGTGLSAASDVASSILGGLVPFSGEVRSIAEMTDPQQRQALRAVTPQQLPQSIAENVAQNIPGLRQGLPGAVDVLGRAIPNPRQGLGEILPVKTAAGQPTPVLQAMQAAGVAPGATPQSVPYGPANEIRLTPQEQRTFEQYRGQIIQQAAASLVDSPQWQQMPDYAQRAALQNIDQAAQQAAGRMVLADITQLSDAGMARAQPTGVLAPVVGYGPDVYANQVQLAQHQALMNVLLSGQAGQQALVTLP